MMTTKYSCKHSLHAAHSLGGVQCSVGWRVEDAVLLIDHVFFQSDSITASEASLLFSAHRNVTKWILKRWFKNLEKSTMIPDVQVNSGCLELLNLTSLPYSQGKMWSNENHIKNNNNKSDCFQRYFTISFVSVFPIFCPQKCEYLVPLLFLSIVIDLPEDWRKVVWPSRDRPIYFSVGAISSQSLSLSLFYKSMS